MTDIEDRRLARIRKDLEEMNSLLVKLEEKADEHQALATASMLLLQREGMARQMAVQADYGARLGIILGMITEAIPEERRGPAYRAATGLLQCLPTVDSLTEMYTGQIEQQLAKNERGS